MKKIIACLSASVMLLVSSPAWAQHVKTYKHNTYPGPTSYGLPHS